MKAKYQAVLFDSEGNEIVRLAPEELKRDAENALDATEQAFAYAEIKAIYVKGGEAVEQ